MRALGFDVKKAEVLKILREYDKDGQGLIEFDDFNKVSKYRMMYASRPIYDNGC
jgi:centrin-3